MRLKTKLVLAITGLVFVLVTVLSALYLSQLLRQQVEQAYISNDTLAHQISLQPATLWTQGSETIPSTRITQPLCERPSPRRCAKTRDSRRCSTR